MRIDIPTLQIRSNTILEYNEAVYTHPKSSCRIIQNDLYKNMTAKKTYSGMLTAGSVKRLGVAIDFFVASTKVKREFNPVTSRYQSWKLSMIVLTIADNNFKIIGKDASKVLLAPFLKWMRDNYPKAKYLWKAELQERGNLHYHIICDTFIHYQGIRNKWNKIQKEAGCIDLYFKEHGHYDPNGTDVHAIYKIKDLAGYVKKDLGVIRPSDGAVIKKELIKTTQNEAELGGKIWDCSLSLKGLKHYTIYKYHGKYDYDKRLEELEKKREVRAWRTEKFTMYKFLKDVPASILLGDDKKEYDKLMRSVRERVIVRTKKPPPVIYVPPPVTFKHKINLFSST